MDIEKTPELLDYLRMSGRIKPEEVPQFSKLAGGVSNRTVLVARPNGEKWVLKQALEKLRVPDEWHSPPERILREAAGMRALAQIAPAGSIPRLLFTEPRFYLLGMECVPEPHENWKTVLMSGRVEASHIEQFAKLIAAIHRGGATRELEQEFADRSFFESLRLEPYYLAAASRVPEAAAFLQALVEETRGRRITLVHGDYSPKNILIHDGRLILLDHEAINFGDPAFDLGFSLALLITGAHHLDSARQASAALNYWNIYLQNGGLATEDATVRHALGCLLARVAGRSPAEYLDPDERRHQQNAVLPLMNAPPCTVQETIERFLGAL